jgi:hypothetical protein
MERDIRRGCWGLIFRQEFKQTEVQIRECVQHKQYVKKMHGKTQTTRKEKDKLQRNFTQKQNVIAFSGFSSAKPNVI